MTNLGDIQLSTLVKNNPLAKAIKFALFAGAAATALTSPTVFAANEEEEADKIQVTGSRIKRQDVEGSAPVQIMTREDIEQTGLTSVGDILQNIPAAGSALNTTFNNGGSGATTVDLRNLGSNRVLVLVNGRRWSSGIGGSVDLNNIPVPVIERIEVLKDGASAIYGSDAITGVVNIITRTDFEGMEADAYTGAWDDGDGKTNAFSMSMGTAGDKGSTFLSVSYVKQDSVMAGDRAISRVPVFGAPDNFGGSSGLPNGRFAFYDTDGNYNDLTFDPATNSFVNFSTPYNYAPENYLMTPSERYNLFAQGSYELSEDVLFKTEVFYGNRQSDRLLAPTPLFIGPWAGDSTTVSIDNPYNPFGMTFGPGGVTDANGNSLAAGWFWGRRMHEAGHRNYKDNVNNWQWNAGVEGSFEVSDMYFDWDVSVTHSETKSSMVTDGLLNMDRVGAALSGDACEADVDCVHLNLWGGATSVGNGSMTAAMIDYITFTAQDTDGSETNEISANISGELFEMDGGMAGFAAGISQREEEGFDQPDALIAAGITSGNSRLPTSGAYRVEEMYAELLMPVLDNLEVSVAARYSDYNNFGSTTNGKIGVKFDIMDDLAIRATYAEAFRAPSISELFRGRSDSYNTITDPCTGYGSLTPDTERNQNIIANCSADGVPTAYAQFNPQIRVTVGGEPTLGPETSESATVGFVYAPSFVDNLSMTLDWYEIEIENGVSTVGAGTILSACYTEAERSQTLCNLITRGSGGNIIDLINTNVNIDTVRAEGADMNIRYSMESDFGRFGFDWDTSYVHERSNLEDGVFVNFAGRAFSGTVLPRIRSNFSTSWTMGDMEANWSMRHIKAMTESCNVSASINEMLCSEYNGPNEASYNKLGSTTYHDAQFSYVLPDYGTRLTFGINNIGDKNPPTSYTAFANSFDPSMFEIPGRQWYFKVQKSF
jgi:iron complex outermembrane recepter protein